jgi:hypothetical protein
MPMSGCKRCDGEIVQKSRGRLVVVGIVMLCVAVAVAVAVAAMGRGAIAYVVWPVAATAALTGAYLLAWASIGRGRWCRTCKRFRGV